MHNHDHLDNRVDAEDIHKDSKVYHSHDTNEPCYRHGKDDIDGDGGPGDANTDPNCHGDQYAIPSDENIERANGIGCSAPRTTCGTQCVNLMTDTNNCGTCGNVVR